MKIDVSWRIFLYAPACVLGVKGPDAAVFLQGQFTNDLSKINLGGASYGLWLDRKGKVIGDSTVVRAVDGSCYWIISSGTDGAIIAGHLNDHIIADEVEVFDETSLWRGTALLGPGTGAWLSSASRPGFAFAGRREAGENWEWIYPAGQSAAAEQQLEGAGRVGWPEMERLRIAAGIPAVPRDIGPADLPTEGGLDAQAISYSKGCYLGQEVMARIKALGRVRRTLVRVSGSGAPPALPCGLWQGGRKEGEIRTAVVTEAGFLGLALVSVTSAAAPGRFAYDAAGESLVDFTRL